MLRNNNRTPETRSSDAEFLTNDPCHSFEKEFDGVQDVFELQVLLHPRKSNSTLSDG